MYITDMEKKVTIGVIAGSVRKESFCKKTARAVSSLLPGHFECRPLEIGNLAMYNQDYDDEQRVPPEWRAFRNDIKSLDGFLFVTPEYNRSFSPVLKNALDIASRPWGQNLWSGKPAALAGVSTGKFGASGACAHLRQTMGFLNLFLMQQPEVYISEAASLFDGGGNLTNQGTRQFLADFAAAFAAWVERINR